MRTRRHRTLPETIDIPHLDIHEAVGAAFREAFGHIVKEPASEAEDIAAMQAYIRDDYELKSTSRFKPKDIVVLKKGAWMHGDLDVWIVLETADEPLRWMPQDEAEPFCRKDWGAKLDMRVLHRHGDEFHAHWVESWMFELYVAEPDQPSLDV